MLVEDSGMLRTQLGKMLELQGHVVLQATQGKHAIRLLQTETPDVVVTDILMPEMDGLELVRVLRETGRRIPIVAISGGGELAAPVCLRLASLLGASATIRKPFRCQELFALIDDLCRNPDRGDVTAKGE